MGLVFTIPESVRVLLEALPPELRLPGWLGPTLCSLELRDGALPTLSELSSGPPGSGSSGEDPLVLGTVRETQWQRDDDPPRYAAFCLLESGEVKLFDLATGEWRHVNSGVSEWVRCLTFFAKEWTALRKLGDEELAEFLGWLRARLRAIDEACFEDDAAYWPMWLQILDEEASL